MTRKPASYEDLEALPSDKVGELVGGALYASPRPTMPHGWVVSELQGELRNAYGRGRGGPGGWRFIFEPELHLGDDVLVPDLGGWRRERLLKLPRGTAMKLAPDWLCEVLSPSTAALDRDRKMPVYAREGVRHVWLMDPEAHTLEVFRLEGPRYVSLATHAGGVSVRAEPFEELTLELALLWEE